MAEKYILDESGNPQHEPNLFKWAAWFETADRLVARTTLNRRRKIWVSTVFLGLDHSYNFFKAGAPVLFETLVFGTSIDGAMLRYSTREQAIRGHGEMLRRATQARQTRYRPWKRKWLRALV